MSIVVLLHRLAAQIQGALKTLASEDERRVEGLQEVRYECASHVANLDPNDLDRAFQPGSTFVWPWIGLNDVSVRFYPSSPKEKELIRDLRLRPNTPQRYLALAVYDPVFLLDPELSFFDRFMEWPALRLVYLSSILRTSTFYFEQKEADQHVLFCEKMLAKLLGYLDLCSLKEANECAELLRIFFSGSVSVTCHSDLKKIQTLKNQLLTKYLAIRGETVPLAEPATSVGLKPRIGVLRRSFQPSQEQDYSARPLSLLGPSYDVRYYCLDTAPEGGQQSSVVALPSTDIPRAIEILRQENLDLLIVTTYTSGTFVDPINQILMARSARKQALFVGDIITSGIPAVDYFLGASRAEISVLREQFTEAFINTPSLAGNLIWKSALSADRKSLRDFYGVGESETLYLTNGWLAKIGPETLELWAQVLQAVPGSKCVLFPFPSPAYSNPYVSELVRRVCAKASLQPDRFIIDSAGGPNEILRRFLAGDVYLDTTPYSGSTSLVDPLQCGLPCVTLAGNLYRSGFARDSLEWAGFPEGVTTNKQDYVRLAVELGLDRVRRQAFSNRIKEMTRRAGPVSLDGGSFLTTIDRLLK